MTQHLVLASALNLRLAPDRDSGSLGSIPRNVRVEEIGANADRSWLRVRVGAQEGWVSDAYLIPEDLVLRCRWIARAIGEFGVGEYDDSSDPPSNPRIQQYHASFGGGVAGQEDAVAWCSSFVNWCLKPWHGTAGRDRSARSWQDWGIEAHEPEPGAVVVFWRRPDADESAEHGWDKQRLIEQGSKGHVSFLVEIRNGQAIVLGGNQSSRENRLGEVNKKPYPLDSNDYGALTYRLPPG